MREYFTLHRSVFPSYLTIESGRIDYYLSCNSGTFSISQHIQNDGSLCASTFLFHRVHFLAMRIVIAREENDVTVFCKYIQHFHFQGYGLQFSGGDEKS